MVYVLGIGGFFFKANDAAALVAWYEKHLDIARVPDDYESPGWHQQAGTTVFALFEEY